MKRLCLVIVLVTNLVALGLPSANAVSFANCVSITDAEIEKKFSDLVYTLTLEDLCEVGIRNYSLTLKSNKIFVSDVYKSFVIIYSYGTKVSFSISKYPPGTYSPSLEIASSEDFERRTVSLPRFSIESPVECLQVSQSGLDYSQTSYSVTLKNICNSLDSSSFQSIQIELQGNGLYGLSLSSQRIYSVSDFGSTFKFNLYGLSNGSYFPKLKLEDVNNNDSAIISLSSFTIKSGQANPTSKSSSISKQLCVTGKNYAKECFAYPEFSYLICSSSPSGSVQYQSGSNWLFGWNFKGEKDLNQCKSEIPFLISISGTSKTTLNMRLKFNKFQSRSIFYSYFKVSVT